MENTSQILLYITEDGVTKIETRLQDETVWLTQAQLAELFQKSRSTVSEHIKHVFEEGELNEFSVVRKFRTTAAIGMKSGRVKYIQKILLTLLCLTLFTSSSFIYSQSLKTDRATVRIKPKQSTNFITFFPDTSLALLVAEKLNKKITDIVTIKELTSIKGYFEVWRSEVSNLKGIGYLTGIDSFSCYKNEVTEIPPEIGNLIKLKSLDLCKAFSLVKIPAQIGKLKHLKKIRLCLTEVKVIPKEIGKLAELETLMLCCNSLTEIPKEIGNLKKLVELDIHSNSLTTLPDEICNLSSLTSLDLSHCGLKQLPENIGNLVKLETLNLFNNDLKYLPKSIKQLHNLSYLNVFDNFKLSENYKKYLPESLRKRK